MSLFEKFDLESMIERAMEHIDMESIAADVMAGLKIENFDMFFVVDKPDGQDEYEFLGMAYSIKSAREMRDEIRSANPEILQLNIANLVPLAKKIGAVEVVS
ncbi:MAG: hypothetical protein V3S76_01275 [Candidatus Bipolaricaulota bacterium]